MQKKTRDKSSKTNSNSNDLKLFARKQIEDIMGRGKVICEVFQLVEEYADQDSPLLIEGETGVGKKEIVNYIHKLSRRRDKDMITLD
ncbi:MAG: sigma-54 factor interaction domain-containing protein, partial [Bacteroidales bacterium]|nr:sigma-54 factor interaction domain-containing protein [Bacteroidales bacterium]